jgi:hypothetical protein
MVAMNPTRRMPAALVAVTFVLIGCTQQPTGPTAGAPQTTTPAATTTGTSSSPNASASGDVAVAVPGEFTVCIPINKPLRVGTDEQVVLAHPDGDMTIQRQRGYTWSGTHTATDPRFSGTHYYSWDADTYTLASGDDGPLAYAEGLRIENDDGAWQGEATGTTLPDGGSWTGPLVMTGEGDYEGFTAVLLWTEDACFLDLRGLVIEFPDPPVPATSD